MSREESADRDFHQWALETIYELVADEAEEKQDNSLWTSKKRIKAEASKTDFVERDEVKDLVNDLELRGEVVYWHGLVAPTDPDHISEILRSEAMAEYPREILIGRLNEAKQAATAETTDSVEVQG